MPTFKYKAKTKDGKMIDGTMEAVDRFDVVQIGKQREMKIVFAKNINDSAVDLNKLNDVLGRVKLREKIIFARNVSAMLKAGIAISRAMEILEKQSKNVKFKNILRSLTDTIQSGGTLSDGMKKYPKVFSPLFIAMVHSGEESGKLVEALEMVGKQLEQSYALRKKVKSAMMYPSIVLIAMLIIGVLMFIYVVPTLTGTFKEFNVELPMSTKIIMGVSDFLVKNTVVAIGAMIGFVFAIMMGMRTKSGKRASNFLVLHLPLISGIVKEYNSAQTARTLSSLFSSGVSIVDALNITEDVLQNSYYKDVLKRAREVVQQGTPLSSIFLENENIYPIAVGEMMQVGEETGNLSGMLSNIAVFYEEEVTAITKDLSTIIEPILMLFIAAAVGFFAVSMISPMYALTASM